VLQLWEGDLEAAEALALRTLGTSRRTGNRWDEWASGRLIARVSGLRGRWDAAIQRLQEALGIVVEGGATFFELEVRGDLAEALAEAGRVGEARKHADRCLEVLAQGEDWRGRAGVIAAADAIVLAHEGRRQEAQEAFARGREVLRRHGLALELGELLHHWGRLLAEPERLDEAAELHRRHGAGRFWLERVAADQGPPA
jgi:tetratricopeptide (TPR) repeat protein